ncbi:MAG TPA: GIY-YIG nuclease family protein [Methylocystis sp.]|nr:GIY-YIG nuclease family protein [Methylocystis sp.]
MSVVYARRALRRATASSKVNVMFAFVETAAAAPRDSGAYALLVALGAALPVEAGPRRATLSPGLYVYCGSANGPGGLAARLARHMRRDKPRRWHVDQLTNAGAPLGAWVFPGGCECAINVTLKALPVPVEGFGSSDCRRCRAHLRLWPAGATPPEDWARPAALLNRFE